VLEQVFVDHVWAACLFVAALMIADYRLSIIGQRWYKRGAHEHYDFGGSYELNPPFIEDVEAERPFSPKHLLAVGRTVLLLVLVWWFTARAGRLDGVYLGFVGFFILPQAAVMLRHGNNIALFRTIALSGGVQGKAATARWLDLKLSGLMFWLFGGVWAALWLLTGSALFVGGIVAAALVGARFWIFGQDAEKADEEHDTAESRAGEGGPPSAG
jgi:hypothetical protein